MCPEFPCQRWKGNTPRKSKENLALNLFKAFEIKFTLIKQDRAQVWVGKRGTKITPQRSEPSTLECEMFRVVWFLQKKIELKRRVHRKTVAGVGAAPDHQSLKKPITRHHRCGSHLDLNLNKPTITPHQGIIEGVCIWYQGMRGNCLRCEYNPLVIKTLSTLLRVKRHEIRDLQKQTVVQNWGWK